MKAILLKYGVDYRVSRVRTDQDACEWMVVVRYADEAAYHQAMTAFSTDAEHRRAVAEISSLVTFIKRDLVEEVDL